MAAYKTLTHDIHCLDAFYIRENFAAFYLVREGDEVAIVETGTCHSVTNLQETMAALRISAAQIKYIIPTHIHLDHAGGAGTMMEMFPQAKLIIHPRGARHMIDPRKLIEGSIAVYGEKQFHELYGEIKPIEESRVQIASDLDCFYLQQRELLFIDTPGHARHHFCIYDARSNGIFSGDTFGSAYPPLKSVTRGLIPTTTPVHFDPVALPLSIDRLLSYKPDWMYLTHYGELADPASHGESLKRWIMQFVEICERLSPDNDTEQQLEIELNRLIKSELNREMDDSQINHLLAVDIKLNAQGILHWWKTSNHD